MRQALVTGAHGFLGRHVVRALRGKEVHVSTLGRQPSADPSHIALGGAPWCPARLAGIIEAGRPDIIFHLAGSVTGSPAELESVNVGMGAAIMQALRQAKARPLLVCCGSAAEYGAAIGDGVPVAETATCTPLGPYGTSKLAQTTAALEFAAATGTPVLVARIFNPIGPGMPAHLALGDFSRQIAAIRGPHGVLRTGNLDVWRDFIDVDHVVSILWRLAENPAARGVVNVCSGKATKLAALVDMLIAASGKTVSIETADSRLRPIEFKSVVGSTDLLARFGAAPPTTDYVDVMARLCRDAKVLLSWAS